jgi:hypothetical protein
MTLHHPQYFGGFAQLLAALRSTPVVFTVRDPVANLESYAKTFLTSFIARRVDEAAKLVAQNKTVRSTINPQAIEQMLMPTSDLWRQYNAVKDSRYRLVEFSQLGAEHFVATMDSICDFLELERRAPIRWTSEANTEADRFFTGYLRSFTLIDRPMELRFSRWPDYWGEFGLVTIAEIRHPALAGLIGDDPLYVQVKADQLLTQGRWEGEREALTGLLVDASFSDKIATQIVKDYELATQLVNRELPGFQESVLNTFLKTNRDGVRRLLKVHPELEDKWPKWRQLVPKVAA